MSLFRKLVKFSVWTFQSLHLVCSSHIRVSTILYVFLTRIWEKRKAKRKKKKDKNLIRDNLKLPNRIISATLLNLKRSTFQMSRKFCIRHVNDDHFLLFPAGFRISILCTIRSRLYAEQALPFQALRCT